MKLLIILKYLLTVNTLIMAKKLIFPYHSKESVVKKINSPIDYLCYTE